MTSKMSRNVTGITFNLFADSWYTLLNEKRFLTSNKAISIALPLLFVSANFNMVTVSKCPSGEEERMSSFSTIYPVCRLPQKIGPVQFWNILSGENQSPAMLELNRLNLSSFQASCSLSTWLQETCLREMAILLNV